MSRKWKFTFAIVTLSMTQTIHNADNDSDHEYDSKKLFGFSPRRDLPFKELAEYDGYECENHTVTTSDGYILGLFRLPLKSSCPKDASRLPIIFMHGLYLSGDDCIIPGPGVAHCYVYSDACYDVWIANIRGNRYSRNHVSLDPDKDYKFWDFTLDNYALSDLPAIINYVLEITGKKQVTYVAHSQGVTICIILCAKKPEYNDKVKAGFGLSVTANLQNSRFFVIPIQGLMSDLATSNLSHFEIFAHGKFVQSTGKLLCGLSELEYPVCTVLIFAALGYNKFQITPETLTVVVGHTPAGSSFANFARWGEFFKYGFVEKNYGPIKNLIEYGTLTPPLFDLSNVSMPWYFIGSENDYVGDLRDIAKLKDQRLNYKMFVLPDKTFGHLDFIYGKDIPNYITPKILSVIEGGPFDCP